LSEFTAEGANEGKSLVTSVDGVDYARIPIRTHVIVEGEDLLEVVTRYAAPVVQAGDQLFVTEKIVAITQGRSYPMDEIQARPLATFLARYVTKTSHGIGLGLPETMEMALRDCGTPRILLAAAVSAVTKLFGRTGDFYRVAGPLARGIDGPTSHTIPPYNTSVVLAPLRPREVAQSIKASLPVAVEVFIVDINDIGGNILGSTSSSVADSTMVKVLRDNPLGQARESTPMGVVRVS
jgi:hypothetical protein